MSDFVPFGVTTASLRALAVVRSELFLVTLAEEAEEFEGSDLKRIASQLLRHFPRRSDLLLSTRECSAVWDFPTNLTEVQSDLTGFGDQGVDESLSSTTPRLRTLAVARMEVFLSSLVADETRYGTSELRQAAHDLLRHFPRYSDLLECSKRCPEIWKVPRMMRTPGDDFDLGYKVTALEPRPAKPFDSYEREHS
ncbi:MAG: hypothetical protein JSS56_24465 [Proteobacteria bacterium]|nr:hypothetical protein [Pseudomonadota bacterium]